MLRSCDIATHVHTFLRRLCRREKGTRVAHRSPTHDLRPQKAATLCAGVFPYAERLSAFRSRKTMQSPRVFPGFFPEKALRGDGAINVWRWSTADAAPPGAEAFAQVAGCIAQHSMLAPALASC